MIVMRHYVPLTKLFWVSYFYVGKMIYLSMYYLRFFAMGVYWAKWGSLEDRIFRSVHWENGGVGRKT